ncbi:DEAD-domain-containing protein [Trametes meyenii]|nr:DEAD-domain-containing protein [Trametes meyenii]
MPSTTQTPQTKTKTKAKKRYLKAKKERRKKRKVVGKNEPGSQTKTSKNNHNPSSASEASESSGSGSESESDDASQAEVELPAAPVPAKRVQRDEPRPKKRRKLDTPEAEDATPEEAAENAPNAPEAPRPKSPTPPVALPAFPLPRRPDAPSKTVLALQGLDRALIAAEVVDPATTVPLKKLQDEQDGSRTGLSEKMRKRLEDLGITELFAVQTAVVPLLLSSPRARSLYRPYDPPEDLCVSAPTGSGKTLAYVLPIVEVLSSRVVTRLRALIVLPTRDLVVQVRETFEAVAKGRGLKIGTATGQHSFAHEQAQLVAERDAELQGGSSRVDVLICTPGRLIDHLNGTPNFSLQHLRFLVIDEADRLLAQSFQDWLAQVLAATRPPRPLDTTQTHEASRESPVARPRPDALAPAFLHALRDVPHARTDMDEKKEPSCQKLLFSATLTRDPAKIAALGLREPKYIVVQGRKHAPESKEEGVPDFVMEKFTMPATLTEHMLVCESATKPLMLFHLVHARGVANALVFTKSAESTTRLVRLFEFFEAALHTADSDGKPVVARAYSSDLAPAERKAILEQFKNQEINILVCSDLISRGIDISHVSHVVSYDVPVDFKKYVHRVGRTARAGRAGDAWTLVEEQEARYFKTMLKEADHLDKVRRLRVSDSDVAPLKDAYEGALARLKDVYARAA